MGFWFYYFIHLDLWIMSRLPFMTVHSVMKELKAKSTTLLQHLIISSLILLSYSRILGDTLLVIGAVVYQPMGFVDYRRLFLSSYIYSMQGRYEYISYIPDKMINIM